MGTLANFSGLKIAPNFLSKPNGNDVNVFTYGTLMFPEVMEALTEQNFASAYCALKGYERLTVRGRIYPGICEAKDTEVLGRVWFGLKKETLAILDYFEDEFYDRKTLQISSGSHGIIAAETYIVPAVSQHVLSPEAWDMDLFREKHLAAYLPRCRMYRQQYLTEKGSA